MVNSNRDMGEKKILVVGLARSGKAAAEALRHLDADVDIYDVNLDEEKRSWAKGIGCGKLYSDESEIENGYDLLVLSPGVPPNKDFIKSAAFGGAEIIGELELAYRIGHGKYIAITGTNGKTTTTTLVGEIFKASGRECRVVGNIGTAVLTCATDVDDRTYMVTECSSFQLETTKYFKPEVSAILNLTPDHLDRHGNMENYFMAKAAIFQAQDENDYFVYNADDEFCVRASEMCPSKAIPFSRTKNLNSGAFLSDGKIVIKDEDSLYEICTIEQLKIPGTHNIENPLAAAAICYVSGIEPKMISSVMTQFSGVEHRMENCGFVNGVHYLNDSKGTNPDAALKAIATYKNIVLIAGGYDKGAEFDSFIEGFNGNVKAIVLIGITAEKIRNAAERKGFSEIYMADGMADAVIKASDLASDGDTVLLSPACASWDMYRCFEDRGDDFKICVENLKSDKM